MVTTVKIFCCYAHEDQELLIKLKNQLMPLQRQSLITIWSDTDIDAGAAWKEEIEKHLNLAHIILLLVSPDFIGSEYCYSNEMKLAMERHERGEARVIPIILRPTYWEGTPFDKLQALPTGARPVTDQRWYTVDNALYDVAKQVSTIVRDLLLAEADHLYHEQRYEETLVSRKPGLRNLLATFRPSTPTLAPSKSSLPLSPQTKGHARTHWLLGLRSQGSIRIALIVVIIFLIASGGYYFLIFKGPLFKGDPTATPRGTVQPQNTTTPRGTVQPQNTTTPTAQGLKLAWTYATKGHIEESSPVVANGMVYIGSLDHKLYAIDAKTGAFRWTFTTAGPIRSSPAVNDGMVYVGSLDHNLYALNATSGAKQWSFSTGAGIFSSPVVANGILYFGSDDGNLYALDARLGTKKWLYSTTAQIVSTPAVAKGMVYFGSEDDNFYALDAGSGTMKWSKNLENAITSSPAVSLADNSVYIISWTGTLSAFDMVSGASNWDNPAVGGVGSTPTVTNGTLYIGDNVSYILYAIDSTSGTERWHYPQFYTPPANGVTYQPSLPDAGITSSPAVTNGVVYIGSADYNLYAIDTKSGNELASYATGGSILSSPRVANSMIYVGSSDNMLYAFHLPGTS